MDPSSPLEAFLALVPYSTKQPLDFSQLDPFTFSVLSDAAAQFQTNRQQDDDLRLALSAKNRALETKLERNERDMIAVKGEVDAAKRNQEKFKAQLTAMQQEKEAQETAKRHAQQELAKARSDTQAIKVAAKHARLASERATARQKERFCEAAILATRNGSSRLVVVPGVFDKHVGPSSGPSLEQQQVAELEVQRAAALASNTALRRLFTDALNALQDLNSSVIEQCGDGKMPASARYLQSDLFPLGSVVPRNYDLKNADRARDHPAVVALGQSMEAGERTVYDLDRDRRQMKQTLKESLSASTSPPEPEVKSSSVGRKGPARVALLASATTQADQAQELKKLRAQISGREGTLRDLQERLDQALQEAEQNALRAQAAEEREQEAELQRQAQAEAHARQKEVEAARLVAERQTKQQMDDLSRSGLLEPLSANKKTSARRMAAAPAPQTFPVQTENMPSLQPQDSTFSLSEHSHQKSGPEQRSDSSAGIDGLLDIERRSEASTATPKEAEQEQIEQAEVATTASKSSAKPEQETMTVASKPNSSSSDRPALSKRPIPNASESQTGKSDGTDHDGDDPKQGPSKKAKVFKQDATVIQHRKPPMMSTPRVTAAAVRRVPSASTPAPGAAKRRQAQNAEPTLPSIAAAAQSQSQNQSHDQNQMTSQRSKQASVPASSTSTAASTKKRAISNAAKSTTTKKSTATTTSMTGTAATPGAAARKSASVLQAALERRRRAAGVAGGGGGGKKGVKGSS